MINGSAARRNGAAYPSLTHAIRYSLLSFMALFERASAEAIKNAERSALKTHNIGYRL